MTNSCCRHVFECISHDITKYIPHIHDTTYRYQNRHRVHKIDEIFHIYCVRNSLSSSTYFLVSLSFSSCFEYDSSATGGSSNGIDTVIGFSVNDKPWYCTYNMYHIPNTIHTRIIRKNFHGVSSAFGIRISQRSFSESFFFP